MKIQRLVLTALMLGNLTAEEQPWQNDLTPPAPGTFPAIQPCVLDLRVSWKGMIDSGQLRVEFAPRVATKPGTFIVRSSAASLGLAAGIFPYQSNFWSEIDAASLKPRLFTAVETDRHETTTSTTRHLDGRIEYAEVTKNLTTDTETRKERSFKFTPVFDIFSAMLLVRSQKLDTGDQITLVVNPFGTPYLLRVKVAGRELHLDHNTIRLSVGMRKIDRNTLELLPYKKLKKDATLWLSDDAERIPIELRAAVFIGDIRATLTNYQKFRQPDPGGK